MEWGGILLGNIVFGISAIATLYSPYSFLILIPARVRREKWYVAVSEVVYIATTLFMLVPRGCNAAYYQYTYRLLSAEIFSYLGISGQMGSLAPHFAVDYWYAWAVPLAIFIVFIVVNHFIRKPDAASVSNAGVADAIGFVIGVGVLWIAMRGGVGTALQPTDTARFCQPKYSPLVSDDAYNIVRTIGRPDLEEVQYMDGAEAAAIFPARHRVEGHDSLNRRNVVIIALESVGQEFMGCYNHQANADTRTPFLDSLARHSTLYDGRSNGKKSIEGITAINSSVPNLMNRPLTNSQYKDISLPGIATLLKRYGYYCAFFHGTYNGVMNFDSTCLHNGFDEYLGRNEYDAEGLGSSEDYDGAWGILDEPFLQYTVRRVSTYKEPFFAEVFTVSSHHPYPMPEKYKARFVEGKHPILKCVEYTDYALQQFFAAASRQPWFENTIFIITGDHSGHSLSHEYSGYDGLYRIPMMVYDPQHPVSHRSSRIVQQIDIMPSLADYLGLHGESFTTFGTSVLSNPNEGWQVYFGNDYYCMVSNHPGSPEQHDITVLMGNHSFGSPERVRFLQALVQQYNTIVINNKVVIE